MIRIKIFSYLVFVVFLSGCASIMYEENNFKEMNKNDGIIFGSVDIDIEEGPKNESAWAFFKGAKSKDMVYKVVIESKYSNEIRIIKSIEVIGDEEKEFIKRLPEGEYYFSKIKTFYLGNHYEVKPYFKFNVKAGISTYVGKIVILLPHRIRQGRRVRYTVINDFDEAKNKISENQKYLVENSEVNIALPRTERRFSYE